MAEDEARAQGRPAARTAAPWLKLLEALVIAGISKERLLELVLAGDVKARFRQPNGLRPPASPEYWARATVDWADSRIAAEGPPFFSGPVEVNREDLIANTGEAAKAPAGKQGGRPPKWDWEQAAIDVMGVIYRGREPERQAEVERLLADWFSERSDETGEAPSVSQIREHAAKIFKMVREA